MPACPGGRVSGLGRINDPAQVYVEVVHLVRIRVRVRDRVRFRLRVRLRVRVQVRVRVTERLRWRTAYETHTDLEVM